MSEINLNYGSDVPVFNLLEQKILAVSEGFYKPYKSNPHESSPLRPSHESSSPQLMGLDELDFADRLIVNGLNLVAFSEGIMAVYAAINGNVKGGVIMASMSALTYFVYLAHRLKD